MEYTIDCANVSSKEEFHRILQVFSRYPVPLLIIHPRVRDDFYKKPVKISQKTHLILRNWAHIAPFAGGFRFVFNDAEEENSHLFITFL